MFVRQFLFQGDRDDESADPLLKLLILVLDLRLLSPVRLNPEENCPEVEKDERRYSISIQQNLFNLLQQLLIIINMLFKATSKNSLYYEQDTDRLRRQQFSGNLGEQSQINKNIYQTLRQASILLPHSDFANFFQKIMKNMILRTQIDSYHTQQQSLSLIQELANTFRAGIQISVRIILLQVQISKNQDSINLLRNLQKAKHMIINTKYEYLSTKICILQSKIYSKMNNQKQSENCLKRCLNFQQNFAIQYMHQSQQIRKQIVEQTIAAYVQLFKLKKESNLSKGIEYLSKAYHAAMKSFGVQNQISQILQDAIYQNQHSQNEQAKILQKKRPTSQILHFQVKKNQNVYAEYAWEEEKIYVSLLKEKGGDKEILSEASYPTKLDYQKIQCLQNADWIRVENGGVIILEDELLAALGDQAISCKGNVPSTKIQIKNVSREEIIKKDLQDSSDDDPSVLQDFGIFKNISSMRYPKSIPLSSTRKYKDRF